MMEGVRRGGGRGSTASSLLLGLEMFYSVSSCLISVAGLSVQRVLIDNVSLPINIAQSQVGATTFLDRAPRDILEFERETVRNIPPLIQ